MIEVDWSNAPEGTTHHHLDERTWWKEHKNFGLVHHNCSTWRVWNGLEWSQPMPNPNILKMVAIPSIRQIVSNPIVWMDKESNKSDGSSADYYKLPEGATELQDLISYRDMNAQMGEIFRAAYRYGLASHSDKMRDAKKIKFYIEAEIARLEKHGE